MRLVASVMIQFTGDVPEQNPVARYFDAVDPSGQNETLNTIDFIEWQYDLWRTLSVCEPMFRFTLLALNSYHYHMTIPQLRYTHANAPLLLTRQAEANQ